MLLSSDVTYVVVGGSGGLGRNITEWLARKGAKHIALLSRSGDRNANVKGLIEKANCEGVNVAAYRCDVSKGTEVRAAIGRALRAMPPIRGVIYGAMVLRVSRPATSTEALTDNDRIACSRKCHTTTTTRSSLLESTECGTSIILSAKQSRPSTSSSISHPLQGLLETADRLRTQLQARS